MWTWMYGEKAAASAEPPDFRRGYVGARLMGRSLHGCDSSLSCFFFNSNYFECLNIQFPEICIVQFSCSVGLRSPRQSH